MLRETKKQNCAIILTTLTDFHIEPMDKFIELICYVLSGWDAVLPDGLMLTKTTHFCKLQKQKQTKINVRRYSG